MRRRRNLLLLFLFLLGAVPSFSRQYVMKHFGDEDGLPSSTIYDIYRDHTGFLWISTDKGLSRCNGRRFERFTTSNGLPDNEIFFCREDLYGRLWIASLNGALCYYQHGVFHTAANTPFLRFQTRGAFPNYISLEPDSSVSFLFANSNYILNIAHERARFVQVKTITAHDRMIAARKRSANEYLAIGNMGETRILTGPGNGSNQVRHPVPGPQFMSLCQDQEYFYTRTTLFDRNRRFLRPVRQSTLAANGPHKLFFANGTLYTCTDRGLFLDDTVRLLPDEQVSTVTTDLEGNLWVGTLYNGVYELPSNYACTNYVQDLYGGHALRAFQDSGRVFFLDGRRDLYRVSDNRAELWSRLGVPDHQTAPLCCKLIGHELFCFYHDATLRVDLRRKGVLHRFSGLLSGPVKDVQLDDSLLYCFMSYGVVRLPVRLLHTQAAALPIRQIQSLDREKVSSSAIGPKKKLWFFTFRNLYRLDDSTPVLQPRWNGLSLRKFEFFTRYIVGYTQNNQLLLLSDYEGAGHVDSIPDQGCIWDKLYPLDNTHLLISTNNLYRLLTVFPAGHQPAFSVRPLEDPFIPLKADALCSDRSNMYFFKEGKMVQVPLARVLDGGRQPRIEILTVVTALNTYPATGGLVNIPAAESRNLNVRFSPLAFSSHQLKEMSYEFQLAGADKNDSGSWQTITAQNIVLASLGPGTYELKVRVKGSGGPRNGTATLLFRVMPPFWLRWYFVVLYIVAFAILVYLVATRSVRYLIRQKEKVYDRRVKFLYSEYKAMNALMNPHFIFNVLNNLQSLINRSERELANSYLVTFAKMIRQNMHNVSEGMIPLQKELEMVANYITLEKLRFKDSFRCELTVEPGVPVENILVPPLLIQPLIENSIKHGFQYGIVKHCVVDVRIRMDEARLIIEVTDNGVGFGKSQKQDKGHQSFGLGNIKKRLSQFSMLKGYKVSFDVEDVSGEGEESGTRIIISLEIPVLAGAPEVL